MIIRNIGILIASAALVLALIALVVVVKDAARNELLEKRQGCAAYVTGSEEWNGCIDRTN